jgi:hypothetical protein
VVRTAHFEVPTCQECPFNEFVNATNYQNSGFVCQHPLIRGREILSEDNLDGTRWIVAMLIHHDGNFPEWCPLEERGDAH